MATPHGKSCVNKEIVGLSLVTKQILIFPSSFSVAAQEGRCLRDFVSCDKGKERTRFRAVYVKHGACPA